LGHPYRFIQIRRWSAAGCLVASLVVLGGCKSISYEHTIEISVLDPGGRLGPTPWKAHVFTEHPPDGARADWILAHSRTLSPTEPQVVGSRVGGQRWVWDFSVPTYGGFYLFFPSLWPDGWWAADLSRREDGRWEGLARFVGFGESLIAGSRGSPALALSASAAGRAEARSPDARRGWNLKVTVEIRSGAIAR